MGHMILSAIIHGLIYRLIWAVEKGTGLHGAVAYAVVIIGGLLIGHFVMRLFYRRRYGRRTYRSAGGRGRDRRSDPQASRRDESRDPDYGSRP